jgi:PAS domain S-box-containing protein
MASTESAYRPDDELFRTGGFLHRLASKFSTGVWYIDAEGRTVFANDALASMLGCTPEEMAGTGLEEFLFPDDQDAILSAMRNGAVVRGRNRRLCLRRGNDVARWFHMEIVPTDSLSDGPPGAFVLLSESTAQRQGEEATAYLSSLVATTEDAVYGVDLGNVITSWNRGAERMFGYSESEALGQTADMLGPTEQPSQIEAMREIIMEGHAIDGMIVTGVRKDGTRIEVALSGAPVFDANDQVVGYAKVARDVTARRKAAETQARLAAIVESSDDAIISKDLNGVIRTWNPGAERVFGYTAAEAVGRSIRMLIPEERQDEEDRILATLRRGVKVDQFLTVRQRKDGRLIDVFVTASPIRDVDGRVVGIAKIARDVTERMSERRERERRSAELERYIQERTDQSETTRNG